MNKTLDAATGNQEYTIPSGIHSGSGKVKIVLEEKAVTPAAEAQDITPSTGKVLGKVTVAAIPEKYADTSDSTGTAADILDGKIVYGYDSTGKKAKKLTGTMANNGAIAATIDGLTVTSYKVLAGYTSGGTVSLTDDIETALAAI